MILLEALNRSGSQLHKEACLRGISYLNWKTFVYAYNHYYKYGITFGSINTANIGEPTEEMFTLLDRIIAKQVAGNSAKTLVELFATSNGDLIKLVINHDLRCGVSVKTFNKIHAGSIPQFNVQLAKEVPLAELTYPMLVQLKYDGVRLITIVGPDGVKFVTRNGNEVNLPVLREIIYKAPAVNYILDGEIVIGTGLSEDRTSISGKINSAMHGGAVDESKFVYHVFDTMSLSEWDANRCLRQYSTRYVHVKDIVGLINNPTVLVAPTNEVHSSDAALELYTQAVNLKYEGLVLKHANHYYTFKRSKDWIKVKEIKTADLKCTGILCGEGKYSDLIGALICEGVVEGKQVKVNVGSGLTDIERSLSYGAFLLQTVEVKYNMVIQDSVTNEYSLFLPRFNGVRFDK